MKSIILIGMPGAGKSFLGRKLAKKLNWKFIDTDNLIKKNNKEELQEILKKSEKRLLKLEEKEVLNINNFERTIISTGGSVCYSKKGMEFLKKNSLIIFLNTDLKLIKNNLKGKIRNRGIIGFKEKSLKELYYERRILYEKYSDLIININNKKQGIEIINRLFEILK